MKLNHDFLRGHDSRQKLETKVYTINGLQLYNLNDDTLELP